MHLLNSYKSEYDTWSGARHLARPRHGVRGQGKEVAKISCILEAIYFKKMRGKAGWITAMGQRDYEVGGQKRAWQTEQMHGTSRAQCDQAKNIMEEEEHKEENNKEEEEEKEKKEEENKEEKNKEEEEEGGEEEEGEEEENLSRHKHMGNEVLLRCRFLDRAGEKTCGEC
ncbi:hypothetical protein VYU27_008211 [Nannochloropsis oceanica]